MKEKGDSESLNSTDIGLGMTSGKPRGKKPHSGEVTPSSGWVCNLEEVTLPPRSRLLLPTAFLFCHLCSDCRPCRSGAGAPHLQKTHCKRHSLLLLVYCCPRTWKQICALKKCFINTSIKIYFRNLKGVASGLSECS